MGRKEDGELVGEAAVDAVAEAFEHFDVERVLGVSVTLVFEDAEGIQMSTHVAWGPG